METMTKKLTNELNKLVEINNDRVKGYETAMKETEYSDLKDLFREMAVHSSNFINELTDELIRLGEEPTEGTKLTGKLYRRWMDMRAAMTTSGRKAVLSSCEFGEDAAQEVYDEVLKTEMVIPEKIKSLVLTQKQKLREDHDKIKKQRDLAREEYVNN